MSINLRQIEVFRAVMSTGSISGASRLLHVSQPAVSRLLAHTETRVGFALFDRVKGRLFATPEAKRLFISVEEVYLSVQRVNELAHDLSLRQGGALQILASPSLGQRLVPRALSEFRTAHPDTQVTFEFVPYAAMLERVAQQQADLGLLIMPVDHPNLQVRALGEGRMVCLCPYDHALSRKATLRLDDLAPYGLIGYDRETPFGRMLGTMYEQAGLELRTTVSVGSPQNACALVEAGVGIALVDEFSAYSWPSGEFVVRPLADAPTFPANLLHSRFEPLSQRAQAFVDILGRLLRAEGFAPSDRYGQAPASASALAAACG
ncbi:LysR family transcriptional regulator [Pseudaquabacterium rugosum]|uniref:LysR family transcriptional regulator n=1 Tax=Pseudaquabacterium rugosum TaxID=2984194 RepID=A0ABU9BC88_9BURK